MDNEALQKTIEKVRKAQQEFAKYTQEQVDKIFQAAAIAANQARIPLAKMAVQETGMGIVEDKVIKNHYAAEYVYNKYKNENLPDANWFIKKVELIAHGDNNTYLVSYEDYNLDGNYTESAGTIIEYKDGNWTTDLPGFSGISDEIINKYNFVNY